MAPSIPRLPRSALPTPARRRSPAPTAPSLSRPRPTASLSPRMACPRQPRHSVVVPRRSPSVTFVADANGGVRYPVRHWCRRRGRIPAPLPQLTALRRTRRAELYVDRGRRAHHHQRVATVSVPELAPFTHTVTTTSVGLPITGMAQPTGTLPSAVTFTYAGTPAATATVGGTPAVCTRGTYPISLTASNIVGTTTQNFTPTVRPVNQAPSFTAGATVTVNEDSGLQTVAGWATVSTRVHRASRHRCSPLRLPATPIARSSVRNLQLMVRTAT